MYSEKERDTASAAVSRGWVMGTEKYYRTRHSFQSGIPAFVIVVASALLFLAAPEQPAAADREPPSGKLADEPVRWIAETLDLIVDSYVDEVDPQQLIYAALEGMVTSLDEYSEFYRPDEEEAFNEKAVGTFGGVGLSLISDGRVRVRYPYPSSPAEDAAIRPGDEILEIDGRAVSGLPLEEVMALLKGPERSSCRITLRRQGSAPQILKIVREKIVKPTVFGERMIDAELGIGYFRIKGFHQGTRKEMVRTVEQLKAQGASCLVIDLRFNHGGLLRSGLEAANLFVNEGVLLRTQGRSLRANELYRASSSLCIDASIPLILLVNGQTASAAEVFAGTLHDHRRALLMGSRTFGKGWVQSAYRREFGEPVIIKLTTARYYTPLGRSFSRDDHAGDRGGLEPDFVVTIETSDRKKIQKHLRSREIPTPYLEDVVGPLPHAGVEDRVLRKAVQLVRGEPVFTSLPR